MQDIDAIRGGGRFFGGRDRRLRQHNHQQALKCPRCDSFNTKFCYYNNYNLSQPRHFCKNCRRYWTKGGVLRNVPVGGGCRKTKRSGKSKSGGDAPSERSSNTRSSSITAVEQGGAPSNNTTLPDSAVVYNFPESSSFDGNPNFNRQVNPSMEDQIFPAESGNFGNMTTPSSGMLGFSMTDISSTSYGQVQQGNQAPALPDNACLGTASVEEFKAPIGMSDGGLVTSALDWGAGGGGGGGGDLELFDLTSAVDPAYWSQHHWTDGADQSLDYLR